MKYVPVVVALALLLSSTAFADTCGNVVNGWGVTQDEDNWCLYACLEFICSQISMGNYQQCDFAEESYRQGYRKPGASQSQCCGNTTLCRDQYLTFAEVPPAMNAMGFLQADVQDVQWRDPPDLSGEILTAICDQNDYVISAHYKAPSPAAHAITICSWDGADGTFEITNPNQIVPWSRESWSAIKSGSFYGSFGPMVKYLRVRLFLPTFVGLGDIWGPWVNEDWTWMGHTRLDYSVRSSADPSDSTCLYISDNPWGPARRVEAHKPLTSALPDGQEAIRYFVDYPYLEHAFIRYFLDHGPGGFAALRSPADLMGGSNEAIEYWGTTDAERDTMDAPDLISVVDGETNGVVGLEIGWQLSEDDASIDYYNVYRQERDYDHTWKWLGSVARGTSSFVDTTIELPQPYTYMVSAAHHGGHASAQYGKLGIYNDFSSPLTGMFIGDVEGLSISSFVRPESGSVAPMPASFAVGCPKGDGDSIVVAIAFDATRVAYSVQTIPATSFMLTPRIGSSVRFFVNGGSARADSSMGFVPSLAGFADGAYRTTFTVPRFNGFGIDSALVSLNGNAVGYAHLNVKSFDFDTEGSSLGKVNLPDVAVFGATYTSTPCRCRPGYPKVYDPRADYELPDTTINLPDFSRFGPHYWHEAEAGWQGVAIATGVSAGSVMLDLEEVLPLIGEHQMLARVSLQGVEPFEAAVFALRNENPKLEFIGWSKAGTFEGETICTEIVRDGHKECFIVVLGGRSESPQEMLGTATFRVMSDQQLPVNDADLAMVTADLLPSGTVRQLAVNSINVQRSLSPIVYKNGLAQNYPNPFNPTTTIAFSLENGSNVKLSIYDVRGALVRRLVEGRRERGNHRIVWDGTNGNGQRVASGVYFYKLIAGPFSETRKMAILK